MIAPVALSESCNYKDAPWLTRDCKLPSVTDPNDACRRVALMKSQGLTYEAVVARGKTYNPNSDKLANAREYWIAPKSWEICNSAMEIKCLENAIASSTSYKTLMGIYTVYKDESLPPYVINDLNAKRFDLNIDRNFKTVSEANLTILSDVQKFVASMNENRAKISSRADLDESEMKLNEYSSQIIQRSKLLNKIENRFLDLLDLSIRELDDQSLRNANLSSGINCSLFADKMKRYTDDLIDHKKMIIDYKNSVTRFRGARYKSIVLAFNHTRYNNLAVYAAKFNSRVEDLITELGKAQVFERFMWLFNDFWQGQNKSGLADNLHTRFYFYSEPLAKLEILRGELAGIRQSANGLPVTEAVKAEAIKLIDAKIKTIDKELNFIKSNGWEGLFALQKASASRRIELAANNPSCVEFSKEFLARADLVRTLEDYDDLSPFYKDSVNSCASKPK